MDYAASALPDILAQLTGAGGAYVDFGGQQGAREEQEDDAFDSFINATPPSDGDAGDGDYGDGDGES
jgi:hypothetical protein